MVITRNYNWSRPAPVVVPWRRDPTTLYSSTVPSTSTTNAGQSTVVSPMSTSDILNARYQAAYNNWDVNLANAYKTLNTENNTYNKIANQVADYYNALAQDVAKREQWLADAKYTVANKLFDDMASQKDYVYGLYGPNGTFTREINTYYDDLGDYLASEAWREMAYADALWAQSWASIGMMRAQRNQAYNEAFQRSLQVMQQELEAKQNIQQNLINFMTTLRQEYWNTANTYIISQYERANDLLNAISNNIASTSSQIAAARLSWWWGWQQPSWWNPTLRDYINILKNNGIQSDNTNYLNWNADWSVSLNLWNWNYVTFGSWEINSLWWRNYIDAYLWTWYINPQAWTWTGVWTWS